jgi:ParB-like chromosome segregation protein Spo0J
MNRQPMLGGNGFAVSRNLNPNLVRVESLKPLGRETRKHPPSQIRKLQASIEQFGFVLPVVIDVDSRVIAGWGLAVAAKRLGLTEVPAVTIADLDEAKLRMLRLALNRLGEDSGWDFDARSAARSTFASAALRWARSTSPSKAPATTKRIICRR